MSDSLPPAAPDDAYATADTNVAGNALRAAREAAGLSIEAVSQHLKLAPRQVRALENGDYAELPGRTFVRGFARNYARLLHLDAEAVVAALPDPTAAPALDRPAIGTSSRPMGELPPSERARRGISRWLIPLVLVALIGAAALYELARQDGGLRLPGLRDDAPATAPADPVMPPAMSGGGTPLPNPLTGGDAAAPAPAAAQPAGASSEAGMLPTGQDIAPSSAATLPPPAPATASVEATLVISYRAPAWTEVRDGNGERLVVGTGTAGSTRTISGTPPFDVVIGNVGKTTITWRGEPVDLSPYLKQNVARMRLQ